MSDGQQTPHVVYSEDYENALRLLGINPVDLSELHIKGNTCTTVHVRRNDHGNIYISDAEIATVTRIAPIKRKPAA